MRLIPWDYGVRNLARSPVRLWLSVAGSALVVLLVLAAAAFVRGMEGAIVSTGGERNVILLGGGLGAAAAWAVVHYGRFTLSTEGLSVPMSARAGTVLAGLAVSAALGLLAGLVPAIRASRREIAGCFRAV